MKPLVLVVDDHPTNLKLARWVLATEGFEVWSCATAEEALLLVEDRIPDVVIVDIALPGMSGLDLCRRLRASAATRHVAVVAMTAFAMKGDEAKARAAGCDAYFTKPVNTRTLAADVRAVVATSAHRLSQS